MANLSVFDYETPQEAQEKQRQKFLQGLQSQGQSNPLGQLGYVLGQALSGGFMENPEVSRAKGTEAAVKAADVAFNKSITDTPPANDVDKELRRLQILRDGVADVNPEAASQLNMEILQLGEMKFQRERLQASDTREAEVHDLTVAEKKDDAAFRKLTGGLTYVLNQKSGSVKAFDLLDPATAPTFQKAAAEQGNIVLTPQNVFELHKMNTQESWEMLRNINKGSDLSKVTVKEALETSQAMIGAYETADRLFDVLDKNPDVFTAGSKISAEADKAITQIESLARAANPIGVTKEGTSINGTLKARGITDARKSSLVLSYAYALARMQDPGGRLSDRDLMTAIDQVGGNNPNREVILANLNDQLTSRGNALIVGLDSLPDGYRVELSARRNVLEDYRTKWNTKISRYAQGTAAPAMGVGVGQRPMGPGPAGSAPAQDDPNVEKLLLKYSRKGPAGANGK